MAPQFSDESLQANPARFGARDGDPDATVLRLEQSKHQLSLSNDLKVCENETDSSSLITKTRKHMSVSSGAQMTCGAA